MTAIIGIICMWALVGIVGALVLGMIVVAVYTVITGTGQNRFEAGVAALLITIVLLGIGAILWYPA